jgi:hypothetical protein
MEPHVYAGAWPYLAGFLAFGWFTERWQDEGTWSFYAAIIQVMAGASTWASSGFGEEAIFFFATAFALAALGWHRFKKTLKSSQLD